MPSNKPNRPCRIDDELYLKAKVVAQSDSRSFNNYVELLIRNAVAEYEKRNGVIEVDTDELYK